MAGEMTKWASAEPLWTRHAGLARAAGREVPLKADGRTNADCVLGPARAGLRPHLTRVPNAKLNCPNFGRDSTVREFAFEICRTQILWPRHSKLGTQFGRLSLQVGSEVGWFTFQVGS